VSSFYDQELWDASQPDWHRAAVGGLWDEIGQLQFDFLRARGLRPEHYLVDVGCGSLRGGVHLIGYLHRGHYYGVDRSQQMLDAGRDVELPRYGIADKEPVLAQMADFDLHSLGRAFDVGVAVSVFTHIGLNSIVRCLINVDRVLRPGGVFYATIFEDRRRQRSLAPLQWPQADGPTQTTFLDSDPYHYDLDAFRWAITGTRLTLEYIGDWGHPRGQRMLAFHKQRGGHQSGGRFAIGAVGRLLAVRFPGGVGTSTPRRK
jgi:SAM-dependent methyltransferase